MFLLSSDLVQFVSRSARPRAQREGFRSHSHESGQEANFGKTVWGRSPIDFPRQRLLCEGQCVWLSPSCLGGCCLRIFRPEKVLLRLPASVENKIGSVGVTEKSDPWLSVSLAWLTLEVSQQAPLSAFEEAILLPGRST